MNKMFSIIMAIILIGLMIMSGLETYNMLTKYEWKPTEVYEFTNKHIEWSH